VVKALKDGEAAGVFALQLHGLEHYWPPSLMASRDLAVQDWLMRETPAATEELPAALQSRWIDAGALPSTSLPTRDIEAAVGEETALFAEVVGRKAEVVVPPTFIWDERVEAAWARHGVEVVVTPGRRCSGRDGQGLPVCAGRAIRNGDRGAGVTHIVRNDYFEPEKGHTAEDGLAALERRTRQGRPCLLETHRSNFLGGEAERGYVELQSLMDKALRVYPGLRFMSAAELGKDIRDRSRLTLEPRLRRRLAAWGNRVRELPRFWRLARYLGLAQVLGAVMVFGRIRGSADGQARL
jgi:hypothetical protein